MTIGLHQVTGGPIGTGLVILLAMSWSKLALICYFHLYWTGIGVCCVYGRAFGLRSMCAVGPVIAGTGGDLLKTVYLNASLRYCSSFDTASVAGYGSVCGFSGMVEVGFGLVGDSTCVIDNSNGIWLGWHGMGKT